MSSFPGFIVLLVLPFLTVLLLHFKQKILKTAFFTKIKLSSLQFDLIVICLFVIIAAVSQWLMGRLFFGNMDWRHLISLDTKSQYNSQTFFDIYSFSHMIHGFIFFYFFSWIAKRSSWSEKAILATAVEIWWEVIENTTIVINYYRANTVSQHYVGDSIINSAADTVFCLIGFYLATKVAPKYIFVAAIALELFALWWARDNLFLNVVMLIAPLQSVKTWQHGL